MTQINRRDSLAVRGYLGEMGVSFSDVFGAEAILWVEGKTEEQAFPLIVAMHLRRPLGRTAIVGVTHTGDFEKRRARSALEIYTRLSAAHALVPPALGFIFDREDRSPIEIEDLERLGQGRVAFLKRRCYESYLLQADAIAVLLSTLPAFENGQVHEVDIESWLVAHGDDRKYRAARLRGEDPDIWVGTVDAAALLIDLVQKLSEAREVYDKVAHGVFLTEWLLKQHPERLDEPAALVGHLIGFRGGSSS